MKIHHTSLTATLLFFSTLGLLSQNNYQVFPKEGFRIKADCVLQTNTTHIQMSREAGVNNIVGSYVCAQNETDPDNILVININVTASPELAKSRKQSDFSVYTNMLNQANIPYWFTEFAGVTAIEYTFTQFPPHNIPSKAIFFYVNNKGYLLQIATKNNLETRYKRFKNSFDIL